MKQEIVKGYVFLPFAKNMGKNIDKNLSGKYSNEKSGLDAIKTADLINNKIADVIAKSYNDNKITNTSSQNIPETNKISGFNTILQTKDVILREIYCTT